MKKHCIWKMTAAAAAVGCAMVLSAAAAEVSNDVFTVTVPDEIAAICDIETGTDTVTFYEPVSHQAFQGGFVGDIRLYKSVRDYGNIPNYRRGGQIVLSDGTKLDVVLEMPSDVQFDPQNEESAANYKQISEAFMTDIVKSIVPADGVFTPQDEVDTTEVYADTLEKLRRDISDQADMDTLGNDGFSYLYSFMYNEEDPLAQIGYQYLDLNGDGYSELLIGRVDDYAVYDLFTQQDGSVIHVLSGGERDVFTLVGEGYGYLEIKETASGAADLTHIMFYMLDPVEAEMYREVSFIYDGQKDPDNPFSIEYLPGDAETVSEEEWNTRMGYFGEETGLEYIPLG